jgi:hypothetical protein
MTLVEVLVAMALLSLLGGTLVLMLHQGVLAWRTGEARRGAYEEAQSVLDRLRDDLRNVIGATRDVPGRAPLARLVCDADREGRQRLAFVRTIPFEARHPIASLAGAFVGGDRDFDGVEDRREAFDGRLRPTGGLEEVLYAFEPGTDTLLRAARAPVGGEASLFLEKNLDDPDRLRRLARPLALHAIHFEVAFWTQYTDAWEGDPPLRHWIPGHTNGPVFFWDSTRGLLSPADGAAPAEFRFWRGEASLGRSDDDVFPVRVRATLVVSEEGPSAPWTFLAAPLPENGRAAEVLDASRFEGRGPFVRIGREWVRCKVAGPTALRIEERGARWTAAVAHAPGEAVVAGKAFSVEIEVPAGREDWNDALALRDRPP